MMKQFHFLPLMLAAVLMTGCSTYQFSARQTDVNQRPIDSKDQMVSISVDYNRQVTATSDYQMSRKDAIAEAEYRCITEAKIDVVVDPIYKVEYNPFRFKNRYKATIVGYAGKYKEELNRLDDSKKYTLEEIEKYKLLYDPTFPENYYRKSSEGDNYFFKSGALSSKGSIAAPAFGLPMSKKGPSSIMLKKSQKAPRAYKPMDSFQLAKAKQLRNAGIGTMVGGAVACLLIGVPVYCYGQGEDYDPVKKRWVPRDNAYAAGCVFMGLGAGVCVYAGVPMLTVGQVRYNRGKKAQNMNITLNAGSNGLGLGLTF